MQVDDGLADTTFMMGRKPTIVCAIGIGAALEMGIHAFSGRREAWDSPLFWTVGMPAALLASLALGLLSRRSNWLWTAVVAPSQVLTMMVRSGEIGSLWPLALILSTLLSAPFVVAAFVGSRLREASATPPRTAV
jgi:hypothetical protein